jgi:hypothetical protein
MFCICIFRNELDLFEASRFIIQLFFDIEVVIYLVTKQGTLMRRSTVLSLPHQLVFPAERFADDFEGQNIMMIEETKFLRRYRQSLIKLDQFIDKKY